MGLFVIPHEDTTKANLKAAIDNIKLYLEHTGDHQYQYLLYFFGINQIERSINLVQEEIEVATITDSTKEIIKNLKGSCPDLKNTEIAKITGVSARTVGRVIATKTTPHPKTEDYLLVSHWTKANDTNFPAEALTPLHDQCLEYCDKNEIPLIRTTVRGVMRYRFPVSILSKLAPIAKKEFLEMVED